MKSILKEYLLLQKNAMVKISKDIAIAANVVEGIKSDFDFTMFAQQESLANADEKKPFSASLPKIVAPTASSVLEYTTKSVVRLGELEISGLVRWRKCFFVLTRYGFLHYFPSYDVRLPSSLFTLTQCKELRN